MSPVELLSFDIWLLLIFQWSSIKMVRECSWQKLFIFTFWRLKTYSETKFASHCSINFYKILSVGLDVLDDGDIRPFLAKQECIL